MACKQSLHVQVRLRDVVAYVAETVGQLVAAESIEHCTSPEHLGQPEGQTEVQAAAICQQRKGISASELQGLLRPVTEAAIVEATPKVLVTRNISHCNNFK